MWTGTKGILQGLGVLLAVCSASAAPSGLTYHGRIVQPNGSALEASNVQLTLKLVSPGAEACVLFQETHTLNMTGSDGVFSVSLGSGTRSGTDPGLTLSQAFANLGARSGLTCASGSSYTPSSSDARNMYVSFDDGSGLVTFASPDVVRSVPYAFEAESVAGFPAASLVRVADSGVPQTVSALTSANFTELSALINGTSTKYAQASSGAGTALAVVNGNPSSPAAGSVWLDSSTGALKYRDGSSTKTLQVQPSAYTFPATDGTNGQVLSTNGSGALSWATPASSGLTSVGLSLPSIFSVSGSPLTANGSLTATLASQSANTFLAAPNGSSGAPTFRTIASADLPTIGVAGGGTGTTTGSITGTGALTFAAGGTNQNVTLTPSGTGATLLGGNVGIGTTSPAYLVDAQASNNTTYSGSSSSGITPFGANFTLTNNSSTDTAGSYLTMIPKNAAGVYNAAYIGAASTSGGSSYSPAIVFGQRTGVNSYAERMRIDPSGNVGIGTTSPTAALDVAKSPTGTSGTIFGAVHATTDYSPASAPASGSEVNGVFTWLNTLSTANLSNLGAVGGNYTVQLVGNSNLNYQIGMQSSAVNGGTGTIATSVGVQAMANNASTGTITGAVGVAASVTNTGGGTITNGYGVSIGNIAGTNKWGLYQLDATANNYFAGKVGIGTTSPNTTLDVRGNIYFGPTSDGSAGNQQRLISDGSGQSMRMTSGNSGAVFLVANNSSFKAQFTSATSCEAGTLFCNAMSKVGIGTTTPTALLQLSAGGTAAGSAPLKFTSGSLLSAVENGAMEYDGTSFYLSSGGSRAVVATGGASGAANLTNVTSATSLTVTPGAGNSLIVNSATASTSSTSGALIVSGGAGISNDLNVGATITSNGAISATTSTAATSGANSSSPSIYLTAKYWNGSSSQLDRFSITDILGTGSNPSATLQFDHSGSSGASSYAFMNGNVGIGTTSPSAALQVVSSGSNTLYLGDGSNVNNYMQVSGRTQFGYDGLNAVVQGKSGKGVALAVNNDTFGSGIAVQVTTAGNVGIGTTTPSSALDVNGIVNAGSGLRVNGGMVVGRSGSKVTVGDVANNGFTVGLFSNSAERLTIDSSGNVGIGTTSPANSLDVGTGGGIRIAAGTPSSTAAALYNVGGALYWNGSAVGGGSSQWTTTGSDVYYNTGNVGIGSSTPSSKLDVRLISSATSGNVFGTKSVVYLGPSVDTSAQVRGFQTSVEYGGSGNASGVLIGYGADVSNYGTGTLSYMSGYNLYVGSTSSAVTDNALGINAGVESAGTGGITSAQGVNFSVSRTGSGSVSTATGANFSVSNSVASGQITTANGGSFSVTNSSGTIATARGIYIGSVQGTSKWSLWANDTTAPSYFGAAVGIGTSTLGSGVMLDVAGHLSNSGAAASVGSCGTSPTLSGNDTRGRVTTGTGTVNSCVVTFASAFASAPYCVATLNGTGSSSTVLVLNASTTTLTVYFSASSPSTAFSYHCMQ